MSYPTEENRRAWMAESVLRFRRNSADALDALLCDLISRQDDVGSALFTTPQGRACRIVIAVGDDAVRSTALKFPSSNPQGPHDVETGLSEVFTNPSPNPKKK